MAAQQAWIWTPDYGGEFPVYQDIYFVYQDYEVG